MEVLLALNMLYALLLYRRGKKNAAGITVAVTLLSASFYLANFFLDEYSKYLTSKYGVQAVMELVGYIEVLTATDSLPAALYGLMSISIFVNFIFSLQYTVLVSFALAVTPITFDEMEISEISHCERSLDVEYTYITRPTLLAHLRI